MTDQRLRQLLEERVADVTTVDLASEAWGRASAVRRRQRTLAGVAVAVVAIVAGTTAVVSGRGDDAAPPPVTNTTETPTPGPKAERGGKYAGVPVWWAPTVEEEAGLPRLERAALPEVIDLAGSAGEVPAGFRAIALFQLWGDEPGPVVVVGADGASYSLDVDRLEPWRTAGELRPSITQGSLSPDGRSAFFLQRSSLEVYNFEQSTWTSIRPGPANPELTAWRDGKVSFDRSDPVNVFVGPRPRDHQYGPVKQSRDSGAAAFHLAGAVPRPRDVPLRGIEAVVARRDGAASLLATTSFSPGDPGRWLQCCKVVGWLDGETVLFESRSNEARILAWRVGTPEMWRVSDIRGWTPGEESYVASFAAVDGSVSTEEADNRPIDYVTAERGPSYGGANIWWAPPAEDETGLPWHGASPLPQSIDLSEGLPALPTGLRAVGVFDVGSRVVVLADDGATYSFATDRLDSVTDESGNAIGSLGGVSPDGRRVFFVQRSSLEVYDFVEGTWSTIETPDWLAEGAVWFGHERIWVPGSLGSSGGTVHSLSGGAEPATLSRVDDLWAAPGAQAVLPAMDNGDAGPYAEMVAQDYVVSESMTRPDGTPAGGAHVLHVGQPGSEWGVGLAYPFIDGERGLGSVAVLDWMTPTQLLYWSGSTSAGRRILAWDTGSRWLSRVSELTGITAGDPVGSSFADLTAPGD